MIQTNAFRATCGLETCKYKCTAVLLIRQNAPLALARRSAGTLAQFMVHSCTRFFFYMLSLYGGAISAEIPWEARDASQFRQVPDTQEVFVAENGALSVIFDLLEAVEANTPEERVRIHFEEINRINGVDEPQMGAPRRAHPKEDQGPLYGPMGVISQRETVLKFGKTLTPVAIWVGVVHLERAQTDLVVTLNAEGTNPPSDEAFDAILNSIRILNWGLFV